MGGGAPVAPTGEEVKLVRVLRFARDRIEQAMRRRQHQLGRDQCPGAHAAATDIDPPDTFPAARLVIGHEGLQAAFIGPRRCGNGQQQCGQ